MVKLKTPRQYIWRVALYPQLELTAITSRTLNFLSLGTVSGKRKDEISHQGQVSSTHILESSSFIFFIQKAEDGTTAAALNATEAALTKRTGVRQNISIRTKFKFRIVATTECGPDFP